MQKLDTPTNMIVKMYYNLFPMLRYYENKTQIIVGVIIHKS